MAKVLTTMSRRRDPYATGKLMRSKQRVAASVARQLHGATLSKRSRTLKRDERLPFLPPEDWYEPTSTQERYRILVQSPGRGYRHILTPQEIHDRLSQLPPAFVKSLEVVQLSKMTRKKQSFPCYGMQWGSCIYLYPIEDSLTEYCGCAPTPAQINEARMYGVAWKQVSRSMWQLRWTMEKIRDFYLNNILIHELAHLLDDRNTSSVDRERFAEWFAVKYGYKASRDLRRNKLHVVRRHHAKAS